MSEQMSEKEQLTNENADNLSAEMNEEALAASLNTDESVNGMQHLDDEVGEESEMEKLRMELEEAKDKYIRLAAEFDNFRKRTAKERMEQTLTAGREVIQAMLDVLDDSERAQKQMETSEDLVQIKEGVQLVFSKLQTTLQQKGLKKMEAINQAFDADLHEAITEIPAPTEDMVGKVIDEVQPGYYLNDKLIRFAKVVVGK